MLQGMVMGAGDGSDSRIEELGREARNGLDTTKYQVTGTVREGREVGAVYWQTADAVIVEAKGYTVRDGQRLEGCIALSNIAIGPQDPALFEPPANTATGEGSGTTMGQANVQRMMVDAMRKQGASDAQIQRMLQQLQKLSQ
jgi:hypothetical protein